MKSFIAAAVAASFLGAMSIAQAGVPAADTPAPVQQADNQNAPASVPGAAGAQAAADESAKMAAMVGGLIVVSGIAIASMNHGGNGHHTTPGGGGTGGTGGTGTTGTN